MSRQRRGAPVDGWLVIDKHAGPTSAAIVNRARHLLFARKAGHSGTLDPFADGLLPIAFGEATKTVRLIVDSGKSYRFTICWGSSTDSGDSQGAVIATSASRPTWAQIEAALPAFIGAIQQTPPAFSALRVDGVRAYALARRGQPPLLSSRPAFVATLRLLTATETHASFEVECGKGFYVRALGRDLAAALGCAGHVCALRRTRVGPFTEADAIPLAALEKNTHTDGRSLVPLLPLEIALVGIPALAVRAEEAAFLRHGQALSLGVSPGPIAVAMEGNRAVAILECTEGLVRPTRVFAAWGTQGSI